jgi:hypothetical protein
MAWWAPIGEVFRVAVAVAELRLVVIFQAFQGDEFSQLDPAVITGESASKQQEDVFKREPMTRLASIHVEDSGQLVGGKEPICVHSTSYNCSDPLRCRRSGLFSGGPLHARDSDYTLYLKSSKHALYVLQASP